MKAVSLCLVCMILQTYTLFSENDPCSVTVLTNPNITDATFIAGIQDTCINGPNNDDICDAVVLPNGTPVTNQDNVCATLEIGEPDASGSPGGLADQTVWFAYLVPNGVGGISVETFNNSFDTYVTLYTVVALGCDNNKVANGNKKAVDIDILPVSGGAGQGNVEICVEPGDIYYVQVDGSDIGDEGNFDIVVNPTANEGECDPCTCTDCADFQCPTAVAVCGGLVDLMPSNPGGVWSDTAGGVVTGDQLDPSTLVAGATYTLTYTYTGADGCVYDTECSFTPILDCDADGGKF